MNQQDSIFSGTYTPEQQQARTRLRKRMRTAQIIALVMSVIFLLASVSFIQVDIYGPLFVVIFFVLLSIASFKWPLICLSILSFIYTLATLGGTFTYFVEKRGEGRNIYETAGGIFANVILVLLSFLIIRGTIAAARYRKLSRQVKKQKER